MSIDSPVDFPGKPPKTSAYIRAILKHVHGANADSQSAIPMGNAQDEVCTFVSAAEFRRRRDARIFSAELARRGLPGKVVRRAGKSFVYVLSVHLDEALVVSAEFRRERQQQKLKPHVVDQREWSLLPTSIMLLTGLVLAVVVASLARSLCSSDLQDAASISRDVWIVLGGAFAGLFLGVGSVSLLKKIVRRVFITRDCGRQQ